MFNRRELTVAHSIEDEARIRGLLCLLCEEEGL